MAMSLAISTSVDRLATQTTARPGSGEEPAASSALRRDTPTGDAAGPKSAASSLRATLGRLGVESQEMASSTEPATPAVKPNLDALNRVLSHYAAQSAGVDTIISLVKP